VGLAKETRREGSSEDEWQVANAQSVMVWGDKWYLKFMTYAAMLHPQSNTDLHPVLEMEAIID